MRITETVFGTKEWLELFGKEAELNQFEEESGEVRLKVMRKIGGHVLTDYGDVGIDKESFTKRFKGKKVIFDNVREDSEVYRVLSKQGMIKKQEVAPYIKLPKTWDEYLASLNKKRRHELRRKMRRVDELGEVNLGVSGSDEKGDELISLIKQSSKAKRVFMNKEVEAFFAKMMKKMSGAGFLRMFSLKVNKKTVAMCLGFEYGGVLSLYNSGFDVDSRQPVGVVMMARIIKWAIEKRLDEVDFLRGDERYKYDLGARDRQLWKITLRLRSG